jgi:branched-subunit amino acid transport protein
VRDMMIMGLVGTGTLAMRSVFIVGSAAMPPRFESLMRFAKPAILAALVGGFLGGAGLRVETVAALVAAWLVARKGGGMSAMLVVGILLAVVIPG